MNNREDDIKLNDLISRLKGVGCQVYIPQGVPIKDFIKICEQELVRWELSNGNPQDE